MVVPGVPERLYPGWGAGAVWMRAARRVHVPVDGPDHPVPVVAVCAPDVGRVHPGCGASVSAGGVVGLAAGVLPRSSRENGTYSS